MTITPASAVTSLLLEEGWEQVGSGEAGTLWSKGGAESPVPYQLEPDSPRWRNLLLGIAQVEGEGVDALAIRLSRFLRSMPEERQASDRSELDLHLEGPGVVRQHETRAWDYGRFVSTLADAVNELIKDAAGLRRHSKNLQVVGGAHEGSVQVLLREPDVDVDAEPLPGHEVSPGESAEGQAMVRLSQILNASEKAASEPDGLDLESHLRFSLGAKRSLSRLAKIMYEAGWVTRGHLVTPGKEGIPVAIGLAGCLALERAAAAKQERTIVETYAGVIDGWQWSNATMHLISDSGEPIKAAVPMILQGRVANLNATKGRRVTATYDVLERMSPEGARVSRTYALASITSTPQLEEGSST